MRHMTSHTFGCAGTELKSAGQREAALAKYQQAVDISPTYTDGFYDLGVYYSEENQVRHHALLHLAQAIPHVTSHATLQLAPRFS